MNQSRFRVALLFACGAFLAGCAPRNAAAPATARHVLLITIDTLRADRVGSYGYAPERTPALDVLARRGTRFTRAYATAPITLTSHASMMTGRYPPRHGARHNGFVVRPDLPTLAEAFKRAGGHTGAFVSAFPLDRRFGLARGFDTYDDEMPRTAEGRRANERPGAVTVDRALAWTRAQPASARLFVWVHLFEPHAPYGSPADGQARSVSERYDDEIAIADRETGRLLQNWRDLPDTLVVAVADHGEAFGEHGEIAHSIFVYDTTLRVPFIMAGPGVREAAVVEEPTTVADLAPTVLAFAGLAVFETDGIDLRRVMRGETVGSRDLYAESFAPLVDFGWAALRSLRRNDVKLVAAPRPELYDVQTDAREAHNIIGQRAALAAEMGAAVNRISSADLPRGTSTDPNVLARLRSLGYLSGGAPTNGAARPDPKDRIDIAGRLASVISGELRGEAAERALREVLKSDAANPQAHQRLGFILAESGRCAEAERHFSAAISSGLPSADPYLGLAMCQVARGAATAAIVTLQDAERIEADNAVVQANLGLTALGLGRTAEAIEALSRAVKNDPDLHQARFGLARALARNGQRDAALQQALELLKRLPATAPQRPEVERLAAALR